jgi:hypothetical protein
MSSAKMVLGDLGHYVRFVVRVVRKLANRPPIYRADNEAVEIDIPHKGSYSKDPVRKISALH